MYIMFISHCRSVDMFCHIELHFVFYRLLKPGGVFYTYFVLSKPGLGRVGVSILALHWCPPWAVGPCAMQPGP